MNKYLYFQENDYELYKGKMQEVLSTFEEGSADSIICDPPYELNFMGKGWDNSGVAFQKDTWEHCFKVLKEGGYLLAFGGSRTFHRIAVAIEDAGFEIRDTIMWLYGSGFPKSMNIGLAIDKKLGYQGQRGKGGVSAFGGILGQRERKAHLYNSNESPQKCYNEYKTDLAKKWAGYGTALKPAYEPIIVARKPFKCSLVENIMQNGVGGLNIDECRIPTSDDLARINKTDNGMFGVGNNNNNNNAQKCKEQGIEYGGRFPANVILTYDETDYEEVCGGMPTSDTPNGSASRYFYCAKASKKDRDEGLELFESKQKPEYCLAYHNGEKRNLTATRKNIHPTVKPVELMQYLVRLVTPKNGTILDCFMGSGSTGKAVMFENRERNANYKFIGVEMTEEYLPICYSRIDYAKNKYEYELIKEKQEQQEKGIVDIFDFLESE